MRTKVLILLVSSVCLGALLLNAGNYNFSGYMPKVEKNSNGVTISIDSLQAEKEFYIYFRSEGMKHYQVRKMKTAVDGKTYYQLAVDTLYGKKVEYFIVENNNEQSQSMTPVFTLTGFTDKGSPEIYFQDTPEAGGGLRNDPLVKIGASLSSATQLHDKTDAPGEKFDATGNIRLYRNIYKEKFQFDFDTNFSYMHNPSENENKVNLSDMKVNFKIGSHAVSIGDLSIMNSDYTTSSLMRRGLFYELSGKILYLSTFFTNAQQKTGFDGFGVPAGDANIFGAVAGFNLGSVLKVRGMFMTGKDNLDSKTVVSSDDVYREGSVMSAWSELTLFNSHMTLKGEFARSNFGRAADSASLTKEHDTAWRAETDINYGVFMGHADYRKVGEKYSSIANLFLENDREGLNSSVGLMIKSFSLNVRYTDQETNLTSLVQPMLHTRNSAADFSWLIANHFQLGAEFGLDNLDYDKSTGLMTGSEDMDTVRYAATLGYIAGSNGITFKVGKTESKKFTSNIDGSVAMNLRFGNFFSLSPSFSYQSTENFSDDSTSKIYNGFVSSELYFIQEVFSLSLTGSWTKNDNTYGNTTSMSANGNLNLALAKLFKNKVQPLLSLRGKYESYKTGDTTTDNLTLYLQVDLSF